MLNKNSLNMDDIYKQNILDHYKHPHHKGELSEFNLWDEGANSSCGDELTIYFRIENERIADIGWTGDGCAVSQAATSMLSDKLIGLTVDDAGKISEGDIYEMLGTAVGPEREKCALLSLRTLRKAVQKKSAA
jgi:nitrogen fixation NifU-like protein